MIELNLNSVSTLTYKPTKPDRSKKIIIIKKERRERQKRIKEKESTSLFSKKKLKTASNWSLEIQSHQLQNRKMNDTQIKKKKKKTNPLLFSPNVKKYRNHLKISSIFPKKIRNSNSREKGSEKRKKERERERKDFEKNPSTRSFSTPPPR